MDAGARALHPVRMEHKAAKTDSLLRAEAANQLKLAGAGELMRYRSTESKADRLGI